MIINSKKKGADGSPFTHVNLDVDSIKAFISITKYQTAANILYASLLSFFQSSDENAQPQTGSASGSNNGAVGSSQVGSTDDATTSNSSHDQRMSLTTNNVVRSLRLKKKAKAARSSAS